MPQPAGGSLLRTLGLQSVAPHVCGATSGVSFVPALSCCDTLCSRPTALPQRRHLACPSAAWAPLGSPQTCLWSSPRDVPVTVPHPSTGSGLQTHTAACSPATSHLWSSDGDPLCHFQPRQGPEKAAGSGSQPDTISHARDHPADGHWTVSLWMGVEPDRSRAPASPVCPDRAEPCAGPTATPRPTALPSLHRCPSPRPWPHCGDALVTV